MAAQPARRSMCIPLFSSLYLCIFSPGMFSHSFTDMIQRLFPTSVYTPTIFDRCKNIITDIFTGHNYVFWNRYSIISGGRGRRDGVLFSFSSLYPRHELKIFMYLLLWLLRKYCGAVRKSVAGSELIVLHTVISPVARPTSKFRNLTTSRHGECTSTASVDRSA